MESTSRRERFLAHTYRLTGTVAFMGAAAFVYETISVEGTRYMHKLATSYYSMVETSPHPAPDTAMRVISAAGFLAAGAFLWSQVPQFEANADFLEIVEHYDQ